MHPEPVWELLSLSGNLSQPIPTELGVTRTIDPDRYNFHMISISSDGPERRSVINKNENQEMARLRPLHHFGQTSGAALH